uniref:Uncharacterized protein n=1 Tax=Cannabis sativa TaxID=3483 RepID=A0A803QDT2_CANSA
MGLLNAHMGNIDKNITQIKANTGEGSVSPEKTSAGVEKTFDESGEGYVFPDRATQLLKRFDPLSDTGGVAKMDQLADARERSLRENVTEVFKKVAQANLYLKKHRDLEIVCTQKKVNILQAKRKAEIVDGTVVDCLPLAMFLAPKEIQEANKLNEILEARVLQRNIDVRDKQIKINDLNLKLRDADVKLKEEDMESLSWRGKLLKIETTILIEKDWQRRLTNSEKILLKDKET